MLLLDTCMQALHVCISYIHKKHITHIYNQELQACDKTLSKMVSMGLELYDEYVNGEFLCVGLHGYLVI